MVDSGRIFSNTSNVLKVCGVLLGVTLIIHCVGLGTTYWVKFDFNGVGSGYGRNIEYHSGLFKMCSCLTYYTERCGCTSLSGIDLGWLKGVQALEIIGLLAILCVGCVIFVQFFCTQNVSIKIWGILLIAFAGVIILAGVIFYGVKVRSHLNFSFGLCIVSSLLCFVCSILLFQDKRISSTSQRAPEQIHYANQGHVISTPNTQGAPDQIHYANQGHVISTPNTQGVVPYPNQMQSPAYPAMQVQYGPPPTYHVAQQQNQFVQNKDRL